jgi:hypothetical protein
MAFCDSALFFGLNRAREALVAAIEHYNTELAHSALGYMTSTTFAVGFKAASLSLHLPELRKPDCCGQHYRGSINNKTLILA